MKCSLLGICAILLSCLVVGSWGGNCDYKFPSGNYYNLQPLASRFTQSNPATATYADSRYLWAPCNIIPPATCNSLANAGMCQVISTRGYNLGMGPTPTWTEVSTNPPTITLKWAGGEGGRQSILKIVCQPGQNGGMTSDPPNGSPEHPMMTYNFQWISGESWACPQGSSSSSSSDSEGLSGGWIFIIVFCCTVFVYLVGGILYQKYRVGAEGFELIPHFWFWLSLPALVKEGIQYTIRKLRALVNRNGESGF